MKVLEVIATKLCQDSSKYLKIETCITAAVLFVNIILLECASVLGKRSSLSEEMKIWSNQMHISYITTTTTKSRSQTFDRDGARRYCANRSSPRSAKIRVIYSVVENSP